MLVDLRIFSSPYHESLDYSTRQVRCNLNGNKINYATAFTEEFSVLLSMVLRLANDLIFLFYILCYFVEHVKEAN